MLNIDESVISKIRAAQALAEGAKTEAEAAAAMAAVERLCLKHNLDIGSIRIREEEQEATESFYLQKGNYQAYWTHLAHACMNMFQVGFYKQSHPVSIEENGRIDSAKGCKIAFYGLQANVESARITFSYLLASVEALFLGWQKADPSHRAGGRSFKMGCADRIFEEAQKLQAQIHQQIQTNPETVAEAQAILQIGAQLMKKHEKKLHLRRETKAGPSDDTAYRAGYVAGSRVDLHSARDSKMLAE